MRSHGGGGGGGGALELQHINVGGTIQSVADALPPIPLQHALSSLVVQSNTWPQCSTIPDERPRFSVPTAPVHAHSASLTDFHLTSASLQISFNII